jgi:2-iminobutanoate/2-iminopropanoate deaminase
MEKVVIETKQGPAPKGKYSQVVIGGPFVFMSGQLPFRPGGELVEGDIRLQVKQILENIKTMLEEVGSSLSKVVKVGVYLGDIDDFAPMNEVYSTYFAVEPPARTTVVVQKFPPGVKVEIDAIALS